MATLIDNDAKVIVPGNYGYGYPTVVSFDDGTLFAGHINDLGDLEIHKSINTGSSWTLDKTITPSSGIVYFNLTYRHTASVDEIYVLYSDGTNNYYVQKRNDVGSWSQVLTFSITTNDRKALIRHDRNNDYLHVCWTDGNDYIKSKYSTNGGSSWSDGINYQALSYSGDLMVGDFDINPTNGNIYIVCGFSNTYGGNALYIFNNIGSYVSASGVGGLFPNLIRSNIIINSSGNYCIVRYDNTGNEIEIYGVGATTWSSLTINNLVVGIDGSDNIYVFYTKTSNNKVYYRKYDGSWGSETLLVNLVNDKFNVQKHSVPSSALLSYVYYTA